LLSILREPEILGNLKALFVTVKNKNYEGIKILVETLEQKEGKKFKIGIFKIDFTL